MKKELKAIVDTNVFISALIGGTFTTKIVDAFLEGQFRLIISELLIKELRRTLNKAKLIPLIDESEAFDLLFFIRSKAETVIPVKNLEICRDPKDNFILECAFTSKPDFIVTGDKDLLVLESFRKIPIITPKEFIKRLKK